MHAVPMWIPTPGGQVFAWYHAAAQGRARDCAVLLCDPFGWHRMVLHRTYRELALRLSAAGFPVLRVDYPGTCDSEGWPRESARVQAWLASLESALDTLKSSSGARRAALFGALLGGSFAAMLAARRPDVAALALWAPYLNGRTAVRAELAAAAAVARNTDAPLPPGTAQGDREVLGFLLSAGMIEDLRRIDLLKTQLASARAALLLPRAASGAEPRLAAHLSAGGTAVELRAPAPDDVDAILHGGGSRLPSATIDDVVAWLGREFPQRAPAPAGAPVPYPPHAVMAASADRVRESAVFLGADGGIFGIFCEPVDAPLRGTAVVLVNGGRNHRSGINRNYTEWARKLAARGHRVLRIDMRGLGDSPPTRQERDPLYSAGAREDVLDAVAWLKARGAEKVACVGLCSGSYHAFHAALGGSAVAGVVLLNPLAFHDDRAWDTDQPSPLRRVLRRIRRASLRLARRGFPRAGIFARAERRIARSFVELCERGVDVCVLYNENEPYLEFLRRALQPVRERLDSSRRFRLRTVGQADHLLSPLAIQAEVSQVLIHHLGELR